MSKRRKDSRWVIALIVTILVLAGFGVTGSVLVARNDPRGFEGFWERKKAAVQSVRPELGPAMDEAERTARSSFRPGTEPKQR